ncbi:MAG: hypothetical protein ACI9UA_002737 [Pseudoalteromonas tetraodonis]|jgi:hypothetical protein
MDTTRITLTTTDAPISTIYRFSLTLTTALALLTNASAKKGIDFNRDIRPILSDKCFACHGPDNSHREADLRLDTQEGATEVIDGRRAIVPGDAEKSAMFQRITTKDEDDVMPPRKTHKEVSPSEIAMLKQWIEAGAEYQVQWIYKRPVKQQAPQVAGAQHVVDRFIRASLKENGLQPAPEADRVTLLRRLSFDLTGLPPSPAEVAAAVSDQSPDAYEKQVDRLLASPAYGERMAAKWLDLVRYADTVGFHGDQNVSQSPYRDYVIRAFNSNMPYDQFTRENLAGDLLPGATLEQKVASGYNRLNMTTEEGGAQAKEYLAKYTGDRVRNVSAVWMGGTLGCAECHAHKFDPYAMEDFYTMGAFFADLQEVGKYGARKRPPEISVPPMNAEKRVAKIETEISALEKRLAQETPEIAAARVKWTTEQRGQLAGTKTVADQYFIEERLPDGNKPGDTWKYANKKDGQVHRGETSRVQEGGELIQHYFLNMKAHSASADDVFFSYVYLDPKNPPKTLMIQIHTNSWDHRGYWGEDKIPFGSGNGPAHHRMGDLPKAGGWVRLEVPAKAIAVKPGDAVVGMAFTQFGGKAWWDDSGVSSSASLPTDVIAALKARQPDEKQIRSLIDHHLEHTPLLAEVRRAIQAKQGELVAITKNAPTMPISVAVKPRVMRVLPRGDWMDESGPIVEPAIPGFLGKLDTGGKRATRLDLANWFTSPDNPMTARTLVNHLWHMYFGTGISNVLADLGNQGEPPVHPELLDWLAVEFMESGWDIKHVVKFIVTSQTYRQASIPHADISEIDPNNRLHSRQSPRRLTAEMVRDNALAISGLLIDRVGGISVHPYQPAGYYSQLNFPRREYKPSTDANQWRRAIYSHWQRTFLHPALQAFDAPAREACTAQRPVSNTPLQALVLMNDPSHVEAARTFAERMMKEGGGSVASTITYGWKRALSRPPTPEQASVLESVYAKHKEEYLENNTAADQLISVGQHPKSTLDPAELAAWTSVARVILNLHETIIRN